MGKIINLCHSNQEIDPDVIDTDLVESADGILFDTRANIAHKQVISMPIAELATLGAGVASLIPAFNTVTQTTTFNTEGLYRLVNAGAGDILKAAKNGNKWGAIKTADGASKMAQFQAVGGVSGATTSAAAINPAIVLAAVALFCIEKKLESIDNACNQILSFLELEKEAEIEADMQTLSSMISKYKYNWDNERETTNNHKLVLDIQRSARKYMNSYQKEVSELLRGKKLFVLHTK